MSGTESLINDSVIEVLQDALHDTPDHALQAALWQALAGLDAAVERLGHLQNQVDAVRWIVKP